jgi:hypothetical protein
MQGGYEDYLQDLPIPQLVPSILVLKEIKFHCPIHGQTEYVTASSCCAQLLWMRQTVKDYGYTMNQVSLLCDNESAIKIAYNPCEHSRTKHIDIRHHFLRDHAIKGDIVISHVRTNEQLADIFTKPLDEKRF